MEEINFSEGRTVILQVLTLLNQSEQLKKDINRIQDLVSDNKARTFTRVCEMLVALTAELDNLQNCLELMKKVFKWWDILVEDREKLLVTISNLEMEKESIKRKQMDPQEIYGHLDRQVTPRKKQKIDQSQNKNDTPSKKAEKENREPPATVPGENDDFK